MYEDKLLIPKKRKIFKTLEQSKNINCNDLKFVVGNIGHEIDFSKIREPEAFLNDIKETTIEEEAQHSQEEFSTYLNKIKN